MPCRVYRANRAISVFWCFYRTFWHFGWNLWQFIYHTCVRSMQSPSYAIQCLHCQSVNYWLVKYCYKDQQKLSIMQFCEIKLNKQNRKILWSLILICQEFSLISRVKAQHFKSAKVQREFLFLWWWSFYL